MEPAAILVCHRAGESAVAVETLGTLTDSAQVLFFTHPRRLVELAQEAVPEALLEMHELGA